MNDKQIEQFRRQLLDMGEALEKQDSFGEEGQKTVALDQQSVGRLSRMDALQQQAMAKATQGRRAQMAMRISAALGRIKDGEFGYCDACGEEIPIGRLELDPCLPTCVGCAAG